MASDSSPILYSTMASAQSAPDCYKLTYMNVELKVAIGSGLTATQVANMFGIKKPELVSIKPDGVDYLILPDSSGKFKIPGGSINLKVELLAGPGSSNSSQPSLQPKLVPLKQIKAPAAAVQGQAVGSESAPSAEMTPKAADKKPSEFKFFVQLGKWKKGFKKLEPKGHERLIVLTEACATLDEVLRQIREKFGIEGLYLFSGRSSIVEEDESTNGIDNWKFRIQKRTIYYAASMRPENSDSTSSSASDHEDSKAKKLKKKKKKGKRSRRRSASTSSGEDSSGPSTSRKRAKHATGCLQDVQQIDPCPICKALISGPLQSTCSTCNKIYHKTCIDEWLSNDGLSRCPHCNTNYATFVTLRLL